MALIEDPHPGDHILVTLQSNVVRSAVYLGTTPGFINHDREGVLFSLTTGGEVVEWVDKEYIKSLETTERR